MTGAGAATAAFVKETDFAVLPADPTYYLPGRDLTIETLSLDRALQRLDIPDAVESVESIAGPVEGVLSASWTVSNDTHDDVRDIIFNDAGSGFIYDGNSYATSSWYLGTDYLGGTVERELVGCTPLSYSLRYDVSTNTIRASAEFAYADENKSTSITPSTVVKPSGGNDVAFHGADFQIDGSSVSKLQSATLSFDGISRLQRDAEANAVDATIAQPRTTLETQAIYEGDDYLELAYGSTTASLVQDRMDSVAGTVTLDVSGTTVATFELPNLKVQNYEWSDLITGETDLTDPVTWLSSGQVSIS